MEDIQKPPIGLIPKEIYYEISQRERFDDVCAAIQRYYHSRLNINPEWIEEYNELIDVMSKQ